MQLTLNLYFCYHSDLELSIIFAKNFDINKGCCCVTIAYKCNTGWTCELTLTVLRSVEEAEGKEGTKNERMKIENSSKYCTQSFLEDV